LGSLTLGQEIKPAAGISRPAWDSGRLRARGRSREDRGPAEHLRKLHEMKDTSVLTVSHELRTLITICRGHLDVLEPGADEREVRAVKETLVNVLSLMGRLVEDLTSVGRLDDRTRLKMETLLLDDFMSSIAKHAEPILGHRLTMEPGAGGVTLHADPQRLTEALLNLLVNAAQHAQGGSPVRFRVELEQSGCRFEVADEGRGLAPGEEQAVFEPFRTGSSAKAGTGLGLSVVQAVARAHGGDCGVVSKPGQSATFWIRIPWSTS
jgi:signal transduction histidine kinase